MSEFKAPENPGKYDYDEAPEHIESMGDRYGEFVPEIGAHTDAADAQPSHEDLLARSPRPILTEEEKAFGREQAARAKRILGFEDK